MNSFDDIKSLIFNVLRSVEVSSNNSSYKMANIMVKIYGILKYYKRKKCYYYLQIVVMNKFKFLILYALKFCHLLCYKSRFFKLISITKFVLNVKVLGYKLFLCCT
eukprot:UN04842